MGQHHCPGEGRVFRLSLCPCESPACGQSQPLGHRQKESDEHLQGWAYKWEEVGAIWSAGKGEDCARGQGVGGL